MAAQEQHLHGKLSCLMILEVQDTMISLNLQAVL